MGGQEKLEGLQAAINTKPAMPGTQLMKEQLHNQAVAHLPPQRQKAKGGEHFSAFLIQCISEIRASN